DLQTHPRKPLTRKLRPRALSGTVFVEASTTPIMLYTRSSPDPAALSPLSESCLSLRWTSRYTIPRAHDTNAGYRKDALESFRRFRERFLQQSAFLHEQSDVG